MISSRLLILFFFFTLCLQLPGTPIPFRIGNILSAEISRDKTAIKNLGPFDHDFGFRHYAYAVVAVKLHKGRTLSIYDFRLKFKDKLYKCVAMRTGGGSFDADKWLLLKTNPQTIYSILFILDSEALGNAKKTVPATLIYALDTSGQTSCEVPFNFINYDKLTKVENIPGSGAFPKVKIDTRKKNREIQKNESF
ncbi:MAG: hypothetical protein PHV82_07425 [Victivallaceae bacterium]|nr:hypothetical protein [Victivallaceae bacterium]